MPCLSCSARGLKALARAAAKAASARFRGMGGSATADHWATKAAVCESCALRVVHRGVSYCGTPFLKKIDRDPILDGCGCPTKAKAKDPAEHCPVDFRYRPARRLDGPCDCKWCQTVA